MLIGYGVAGKLYVSYLEITGTSHALSGGFYVTATRSNYSVTLIRNDADPKLIIGVGLLIALPNL